MRCFRAAFTLIELMVVVAIITIVIAIALPTVMEARKSGNEGNAVGSLRTIAAGQALFREADRDGDGLTDYGNLAELAAADVIDQILATGTKAGYRFETEPAIGDGSPDWRLMMYYSVANPRKMDVTGNRAYASNYSGVIFYTQQLYVVVPGSDLQKYAIIPPEMYPIK